LFSALITPPLPRAQGQVLSPKSNRPSDVAVKIILAYISRRAFSDATNTGSVRKSASIRRQSAPERCKDRPMAQRKTLLVVDDNDDLRVEIAEQLAATEDFNVHQAATGLSGVEEAVRLRPT